jgi:DNA-binding MarR family transcriptional regulator
MATVERVRSGTWAEVLLTFVQRYPGVHLREIRRRLGIPIGTLDYHLYRLGREGLITVRFNGGYKCAYPSVAVEAKGPIPDADQQLLALLRQSVPRALLLHLYLDGPSSPAGLAGDLGASPSNLAYFLKRLEAAGVLVREGSGSERRVRLTDPKRVHEVLLLFPPLPEGAVDRFLRFWQELHP